MHVKSSVCQESKNSSFNIHLFTLFFHDIKILFFPFLKLVFIKGNYYSADKTYLKSRFNICMFEPMHNNLN